MTDVKADKPGVVAPPPLIFLAGILSGLLIGWYWPGSFWPGTFRYLAAVPLIAAGFFVAFMAILRFRKARTHVEPYKPTTAIVTSGPFRFSRNPIYLAMVAVMTGTGIAFDNYWIVLMLAPVLVVMHYGVITREERYLAGKFGEEYRRYRSSVRRWV